MAAIESVDKAFGSLQEAQSKLSSAILGRDVGNGRCLFTNAHPELGKLSDTTRMIADILNSMNNVQKAFQESWRNEVGGIVHELISIDDEAERNAKRKAMEKLSDDYESKLCSALSNRNKLSPKQESDIIEVRKQYELSRFDLVAELNKLDGKKKRLLCHTIHSIYNSYAGYFYSTEKILSQSRKDFTALEENLFKVRAVATENEELWGCVRAKLEGELIGAAAPPGAPPGALSPIQPRNHIGMPTYTSSISIEVLSSDTRSVSIVK
jgi:hypothetical protein